MTTRHINPNMVTYVNAGIEHGASVVGMPSADWQIEEMIAHAEELAHQLADQRTGRFLPATQLAYAEGFIAAYRAATEYQHICEQCGGTLYDTGSIDPATGVHEVRCTGCDYHNH